jgi:regulatory protein
MRRRRNDDGESQAPPGTPRLAALRLLGRRDYTGAELLKRLTDRGYTEEDVRTALARLTSEGAIDDRRTAMAHVRTASRVKGRGSARIARELEARGVPSALIREATATLSAEDDRRSIDRFLARKSLPRPLPYDQRRRLFQQLLRRGFPAALIGAALSCTPPDDE